MSSATQVRRPGFATAPRRTPLQLSPDEIKRRIMSQFNQKASWYFDTLKKFLEGNMGKNEFDSALIQELNEGQRKLHNLFILTIIRKATTGAVVSTDAPTLNSVHRHRPSYYMPHTLNYFAERDLKQDSHWMRIKARLESSEVPELRPAPSSSTSLELAHIMTLGLEQYLLGIMSRLSPSARPPMDGIFSRDGDGSGVEMNGAEDGDAMDIDDEDIALQMRDSFEDSLFHIYSQGEDVEVLPDRRPGRISRDDVLAAAETSPVLVGGHLAELRLGMNTAVGKD